MIFALPFRSRLPGGSFHWLLWSDALSLLALMVGQVAQTLGPALAGVALAHWNVRAVYLGFGPLSAVSAFGFFLIPGFRAFMALGHDEVDDWYGKTYPRVFENA